MDLSYMMAGNAKSFIEIVSSSSPSHYSAYSLSIDKSVVLDESSPPSSAKKCDITPRKLNLTPMGKGSLDIMSLFAKKPSNIDAPGRDETIKGKQIIENKCEDITQELNLMNQFVKEQIQRSKESHDDKEMEIFELKQYFIKQMKELQERNQNLLNENMVLKEIHNELDRSAEKIAVFRSGQKSLNICSYLYDSWKNRESKADLYNKYIDKVQQYDELLKKHQQLESEYLKLLQTNNNQLLAKGTSNQMEVQKKKRGRKPKNSQQFQENSFINIENENSCEVLTKKLLKSLETEGINSKNIKQRKEYIIDDDNKSDVSVKVLKEKTDFYNKRNQLNATPIKNMQKNKSANKQVDNKTPIKQIVLLDSDKSSISQKSQLTKKQPPKQINQNNNNNSNNNIKKQQQNQLINEVSRKNSYCNQIDDQDNEEFDDNRSTVSNNCSKRENKKKKIVSKQMKKFNQEAQDTAFNSIADTLFNF
ncbi:hypothetical protein TTHERM_000688831 (macronuclear) [Tetrahymena thermophila SB210]|uniref:Uncharacterized protein n=1 Tax=Tetrahymena thermophila (strain SB210) TaxID=312017 RepID=W7X472_TETTS|nr:hypothetical protein TTHERM_000688831 [Tetrahymena thermophila SB210]EWS71208.1 hypothetical protein TTHERM_000688831 [Tetrahymena thermophila SB210]|eukprot:XP_012656261.1 hypothetical protein TTHERM_000688831 [Tetrahymena thermophila SB210]